ncbi:ABC transporter substrate-binding protein [Nesterenkonia sp. NBAIMH1]|uniref:ABC transporter substrate-binding protein n=1 Tax=Nesterenkonia sp. NBAIMH1 TaxID=2600320 RepID=UPI001FED77C0|nr:ABC transporter substrate-binding protein [Nesterenkonia sp. NBAIMH1]
MTFAETPWMKAAAFAGIAALTLTACGDDGEDDAEEAEAESDVDFDITVDAEVTTLQEGTLQVCSDVPYPPFEYYDEDGEVVGFDIDIAQAIADAMDKDLEIIESAFEGIQSGVSLNAEQCDLAISSISITEERQGNMAFSDPYLDDNLGLLAAADSGIESLEDAEGAQVGVQQATTGADEAQEMGLDTVEFVDSGLLIQGLEAGQVEAAVGNISILGYQAGDSDEFEFVEEIETGEQLGIAAQLENEELIEAVNDVLAQLEENGYMDELEQRWFESDETPEEGEGEDAEEGDVEDEDADEDSDD